MRSASLVSVRLAVSVLAAPLVAGLAAAVALGESDAQPRIREGGTIRILVQQAEVNADPAIGFFNGLTCAPLLTLRGTRASALVPEAAAGWPAVSNGGRRYTFTVRRGFRFSDGTRVTAAHFAFALNRLLSPKIGSPFAAFFDVVAGASAVRNGKAANASGVRARGRRLTIDLTRPVPDFVVRTPSICPVPLGLPRAPLAARAPFPAAGPYYVTKVAPGKTVTLQRNRFYAGARRVHAGGFFARAVEPGKRLGEIERAAADLPGVYANALPSAAWTQVTRRHRVNEGRLYVTPGRFVFMLALNTDRPLFRNNARLRQAVNFALDRRALARRFGPSAANATDQLIAPAIPGFRNEHIYPLKRPDLRRARALARGRTRGGKAVLYTRPEQPWLSIAPIVKRDLQRIGLAVEVKQLGAQAFFTKVGKPGEPYDLALFALGANFPDPYAAVTPLLSSRELRRPQHINWARFGLPRYDRLLAAAAQLSGAARYRAYAQLDARVMREEAPYAPFAYANERAFVSRRIGCVVMHPLIEPAMLCLRR